MYKEIIEGVQLDMEKSIDALENDLSAYRTGQASTALVDKIQVEYYGVVNTIQSLAQTATPEAQQITIRPYDVGALPAIEKAIQVSDLGIMPSNDGKLIRLKIPPLTEERRRSLAKQLRARVEEAKISIRNHRRSGNDDLKELEKEKEISEDQLHQGQDEVQKLTDTYIAKVDEIGKAKEKEVMTI